MAYSELIKSFEKIRDYMRQFYIYGFKSRENFTKKSARSYDDERRRIESWLGGFMSFRRTAEGKNVFLSVDNRSVLFNPLYSAWKAKSFTDKDIVLHFCILDLLADGEARSVRAIADGVAEYLSHTDAPFEVDESTVRNKLKEYASLGLLRAEKQGRTLCYRTAEDAVNLPAWAEAAAFFSEEAPLGVIGSYVLDREDGIPDHFSYKHHYLLHTLDSQILYDILLAMKEKRCIDVVNFGVHGNTEHKHRVYPLRFYVSTQTGREYLLAHHYKFRRPMFFRLDTIRSAAAGPAEPHYDKYEQYAFAGKFDENLWGVSTGDNYSIDHVELTVHVGDGEGYILDRLEREKRRGRIEMLDDHTYRFVADVYDAGELLPWARTFIGRIVRFESSNKGAESKFYEDIRRLNEMYAGGEEP